ncbi:MAG: hypothetical protein JWP40_3619 [Blastococcus sp.]|jgi:hypothetical protein|nr:hypothetical protein [Blastococcus sp.]
MTLLRLSSEALARSHFALSPAAETLAALMSLRRARTDDAHQSWHTRQRPLLLSRLRRDPLARGLAGLLGRTGLLPEFLCQPPRGGMTTTIEQELAKIAATSDEQVARHLREAAPDGVDLGWSDVPRAAERIAAVLHQVWDEHVAADWPRRRTLLERDVLARAGAVAAYGWAHAVDDLRPGAITWQGVDAIRINDRPHPDRVVPDTGLIDGMVLPQSVSARSGCGFRAPGSGAV